MSDIETKTHEILRDSTFLRRLLTFEKERRGVAHDALVFVGMADVASHWWCTQKAVFTSRANELSYFAAYLQDRLRYARRLNLLTQLPSTEGALLDVGKEVTLADVQKLLREQEQEAQKDGKRSTRVEVTLEWRETVDRAGNRVRLINPNLPPWQRQLAEETAAEKGVRVGDLEDDPKWRGEIYQKSRAEKHPTIRWNFPWCQYIVVGVPDGITNEFVYEYRTTRREGYLRNAKPGAFAQADLYGFFFCRPKKRVQIHLVEENDTRTWEEPVDRANAEGTLSAFARVDRGEPARPP